MKQKKYYGNSKAAKELFQLFSSYKQSKDLEKLLKDLLTESELSMMIQRWEIAKMVDQDIPYQRIWQKTGSGMTTISRVTQKLLYGQGGLKLAIKKIKK